MVTSNLTISAAAGKGLVINEIDYDNVGTDSNEYVEILNTGAMPIALANYSLVLVNGSNNMPYLTLSLASAGTLKPGQYLVVGSGTVMVPATALSVKFAAATNNVQNGSPDGALILNTATNTVVDALSYEGAITMAAIPGVGTVSLVEGTLLPAATADSNTTDGSLCRMPDGSDTNDAATDWKFCTKLTPGAANAL
jgi:hypothetical protein